MALIGNPIVATQPVDNQLKSNSANPVENQVVKAALDLKLNISDIDTEMSNSSTDPVQNKVIVQTLQAGSQATKAYHVGLYLNNDGDLCYDVT